MALSSADARRLAAFAALSLFVALNWVGMLTDPPLGRTALSWLVIVAAVAMLPRFRALRWPGWAKNAAAVAALSVTLAAALVTVGLPARLLLPTGWSELLSGIDLGFAGIGDGVSYPYAGPNEWSRLIMLLGAPVLVAGAALLTFLPLGRDPDGPRLAGLGLLVAGYGIAATMYDSDFVVLRGLLLLIGVVAWLWLPTIERRAVLGGTALVALALIAAVPFTLRFEQGEALVDYQSWSWGTGGGTSFNWEHSYGPIDWERSAETVMVVKSETPNYWKAAVLDYFDGRTWTRSSASLPNAELPAAGEINEDWVSRASVSVDEFSSTLIVGPGSAREVTDETETELSDDGSLLFATEPLEKGDAYKVAGYTPDPSVTQMRAAGWDLPIEVEHLAAIDLPSGDGASTVRIRTRGIHDGDGEEAEAAIADSAYARMGALAGELTADAPTAYDAVKAVERHLLANYTYAEDPPDTTYPLESFLFEDRIGYCQQFSGAMALMLRMEGIPARVATGFSPGTPDGGRFVVRALDAHSWVEVYFGGVGWVPFDPTPATAPAETRNGGAGAASSAASSLAPLLNGIEGFGGEGQQDAEPEQKKDAGDEQDPAPAGAAGGGSGPPGWLAALIVAMIAGGGLIVGPGLWRQSRERRFGAEAAVGARVAELETALRRLGYRHQPDATLLELEQSFRSRAEPLAARYVERLRRLRYEPRGAGAPPNGPQRRALRRRLRGRGGLGEWIASYRAIPPFSPRR